MTTNNAPFTTAPPAWQLPSATALGAVTLQVADLNRSVEYYQRVIGLSVISRSALGVTLGAAGDETPLVHLAEKRGVQRVPTSGLLGLYHFALLLPSRSALGQLLIHLETIEERAGMADHLVSEALYLTDPDGLGIEVYADRPRASWMVQGDALAMASNPLDVRDLAASAGQDMWAGMPIGTRMGHVHLHVGNLEDARQFYHEGLGLDRVNLRFKGALFMSAGGYHHHLGTNTWAAHAPKAGSDDARLLEWELQVPLADDVRQTAQSLQNAGFAVQRESHAFTAADPWGTVIRVCARN